jgi:3-oxoacyl-[acyl-carrier-protein] synthase-3
MKIKINSISYYLPVHSESSESLKDDNPDWDIEKIIEKTGIKNRFIAAPGESTLDIAFKATRKLILDSPSISLKDIDLLILVTQSSDFILPSGACILQDRLKLSKNTMAFDINLGCSGFIYALSVIGGLISAGVARNALLICADTYSKYIDKNDRTCRPIFSDGAAAIWLSQSDEESIGPFDFGTDGAGFEDLIIKKNLSNNQAITDKLFMNGSEVFLFTMDAVPSSVNKLLIKAGISLNDIDFFVFHQASKLVIDNLIRKLEINPDKVFVNYENIGNTVSASIPIALSDMHKNKKLKKGNLIMLVGFGVGLSWGSTLIRW